MERNTCVCGHDEWHVSGSSMYCLNCGNAYQMAIEKAEVFNQRRLKEKEEGEEREEQS